MTRLLCLIFLLLIGGIALAQPVPPTGCTTTSCTGTALPRGTMTVAGSQLQVGAGNNVRPACAIYKGTGAQADFTAISKAGFNCVELGWRDAYLAGSGSGTTTFDDEFATAPWLAHEAWQSGDKWSFAGTSFHTGIGEGPTWWANPIDTPAAAPVYSNTGGTLNLSLIKNPAGSGISPTGCNGGVCNTIGALINNQLTPGGLVQLFGYHEFSVAVPATVGFLFHWDIECLPATCSDGGMEINADIWTDGSSVQHIEFSGANETVPLYSTTAINITNQNIYGINWQSDFITFYLNGSQVAQVANPGGEFLTDGALSYFATTDSTYFGFGPAFTASTATAVLDYYRVYQTKPTGAAPAGCNTQAQIVACVANATTSSLAVVFNHLGNEIPTAGCVTRQQNGLWFDQGTDSGGDDGCGDGGNWSAAAFQQNTVNLLGAFNNNPTVIGYEFHNEPMVSGAFTGTGGGGGGSSGTFSVNSSGQIIDPNGNVWVARGVNIVIDDANAGTTGPASLSALQAVLPRVNYIRIWGAYTQWTPSNLNTYFTSLTNAGIAVAIEDYAGTGNCRSGGDLQNAGAWYNTAAKFYASNPGIVFESQNECFDNSGGQPSRDQINTNYYAVHQGPLWAASTSYQQFQFASSNGNNYEQENGACTSGGTGPSGTGSGIGDGSCSWNYMSPSGGAPKALFFIGSAGGAPDPTNGEWYFKNDATLFGPMTNIAFDIHPYPDAYNAAQNQTAYNTELQGWISSYSQWNTTTESSIPVIAGEVGNCGNTTQCNSNNTPISGWQFAVHAVAQVATGTASTGSSGVGWWKWECCDGSNVDVILVNGSVTNPFGVQVQSDTAGMAGTGPTPFTGGGGGGGGGTAACTVLPSANSCSLTQAQANAVASAIQTEQTNEVPVGECFNNGICHPQDFLVGDIIITTAGGLQLSGNLGSLTDSNGNTWTLQGNQTCQGNPGNWWWGGIAENGTQVACGYAIAIRELSNGHVWIEQAKQGGWSDATAFGISPPAADFLADPGPGTNNASGGGAPPPPPPTGNPPVNWAGGGPTDIRLACSTVGTAVFAVNPGVVEFCPGPINNSGTTLLSGATKP